MNILAFDTSGPSLSVALMGEGALIFECTQQNGRTHSEALMPLIDQALTVGRLAPQDIDMFAVTTGPGSFTGVRIGVTTAKALAHATGKPCIGINALETLAANMPGFEGAVCPLQDARAGQVYAAVYRDGEQIYADTAIKLAEFLELIKPYGRCGFVGDGAIAHREAIEAMMGEAAVFAAPSDSMVRAARVAQLAAERTEQAVGWQELLPYYLRAPQAERERLAREAAQNG